MKIRNRITIWITGAGLLAALLFSIVIFYELIEQPFEILDNNLAEQASITVSNLSSANSLTLPKSHVAVLPSPVKAYWVKIYNQRHKVVYSSDITKYFDIPLKLDDKHYNALAIAHPEQDTWDQGKNSNAFFRVRVVNLSYKGEEFIVQIAKPMGKFWDEIVDLGITIGVGLVVFTLVLLVLGYFVAGEILEPIATINRLAKEINDRTLEKRVPLNGSHDELHTLATSLNQMFDRLQFSFQHQKEFIANASHELKTPIAMLRLFFGEALQNEGLPEDFRKKLAIQSGVTFRMNQLVKNLLDLSTLEINTTLKIETVDLSKLAMLIFEEFAETIRVADIRLTLDIQDGVHLQADKEKIRKVLINLIDNAIKYNLLKKGEIQFSLSRDDNFAVMEISNSGYTIPDDELETVFDQFHRVEKSRSSARGGSGLGLTIVRQIIKLHHGTVSIKTEHTSRGRVKVETRIPVEVS